MRNPSVAMAVPAVLFIDPAHALGGAEHSLLLLFECLDRDRFTPHLATPPGPLAERAGHCGVVVHEMPLARLRGGPAAPWRLARDVRSLSRVIRREGISLVHANTLRASLYGALAARLTGRPFLWHVRDLLVPGVLVRALCAMSDAAIVVSAAASSPLPCQAKTHVIPNGVRMKDFSADGKESGRRLRASWGIPRDAPLVAQVARLVPWKGQMQVVAVADHVLREFPDAYFALVGGDIFGTAAPYEEELRAEVQRRGLSDRVLLPGHQEDVAAVLGATDVLLHASDDEPFGRILIEAAAAGVPTVAFASGGVPEIVVDEVTGLLVAPQECAAMANAVCRLLGDGHFARQLGRAARQHAQESFAAEPLTRRVEALFDETIRARSVDGGFRPPVHEVKV